MRQSFMSAVYLEARSKKLLFITLRKLFKMLILPLASLSGGMWAVYIMI